MPNGVVRSYIVRYTSGNTTGSQTVMGRRQARFETLRPFTNYTVTVAAVTVLQGESSAPIIVTTLQDSKFIRVKWLLIAIHSGAMGLFGFW